MALDENIQPDERRRHTELRLAIDRIAEQAAVRAARRTALRAGAGYAALLLVLFIGAQVYSRSQERHLRDGLMASCVRVNSLRVDEANRNAQVLWAAFYHAREREDGLANRGGPAARLHRQSVEYLNATIAAMRWTPATDCNRAVDHARSYRPPLPRPFTRRYLDLREVPR